MKLSYRITLAVLILWSLLLCFGVSTLNAQIGPNVYNAAQFAGKTAGERIANAQLACAAGYPTCVITIPPSLGVGAFPQGVDPAKCPTCTWLDYRTPNAGGQAPANVKYVERFAGATADVQLNACLAALASSGGTCDARGFGATTQSIAATVSTTGAYPVTLVFDPATTFTPVSATTGMFAFGAHTHVIGLHVDARNLPTFSGTVVSTIGAINGDWTFEQYAITLPQHGTCVNLNGSSVTSWVVYAGVSDGICLQGDYGYLLTASGAGWVNANVLKNAVASGSAHDFAIVVTGSSGAQVSTNTCVGCSAEKLSGLTYNSGDGLNISVAAGLTCTTNWFNLNTYDFGSTSVIITGPASYNTFQGAISGGYSDAGAPNTNLFLYGASPWIPTLYSNFVQSNNLTAAVKGGNTGAVTAWSGDATHSGLLGFYDQTGQRNGYFGNDANANLSLHLEHSGTFQIYGGKASFNSGIDLASQGATNVGNMTGVGTFTLGNSSTALSRYAKYTATLSPSAVAAATCATYSATVTGIQASDYVLRVQKPTEQAGLAVTGGRVTGANTVAVQFCNPTAGSITPTASETYTFVVVQ